MTNTSKRFRALVPLGVALAVVAIGIAVAAGTAGAQNAQIRAAAYKLTADMTSAQEVPPVQAPTARGHFTGVLIRTGVGMVRVAALAGCKVVVPPKRSGLPVRINCGGAGGTLPTAPGQWRLIWHLAVSGLSGPVAGVDIHLAPVGHAAATLVGLCGPCAAMKGHKILTPDQGVGLATSDAYVNASTVAHPGGEIRGQIVKQPFGFAVGRLRG